MIVCYFDGGCAPKNPNGHVSCASIVLRTKRITWDHLYTPEQAERLLYHYSGKMFGEPGYEETSNNMAEYMGYINVVHFLAKNNLCNSKERIHIFGDSQLVVKQMRGEWKIKNGAYFRHAMMAKAYNDQLQNINVEWIPRESNTMADELSNKFFKDNNIKLWKK